MITIIRPYLKGVVDSLNGIHLSLKVLENNQIRKVFNNLIIYNLLICLPINLILRSYPSFCKHYFNFSGSWLSNIYYLLIIIIWTLPHYLIGLMYNGYYTNKSIATFIDIYNSQNLNLKYQCYDRYTNYLVNKGYYQIIITFLTLETLLISYIPYIGIIMDWFLTSLIYSYYSWEYSWSNNKVPHINRYAIFETNWIYYLGYGSLFGFIKINIGFLNSTYVIASIFPILSMNTLLLFRPEKQHAKNITLKLPLFYLPIKYADNFINYLANYLKNKIV